MACSRVRLLAILVLGFALVIGSVALVTARSKDIEELTPRFDPQESRKIIEDRQEQFEQLLKSERLDVGWNQ